MPATPDGRPVVLSWSTLRSLGLHEVRLAGGFWGRRQQVNARATLDPSRTADTTQLRVVLTSAADSDVKALGP